MLHQKAVIVIKNNFIGNLVAGLIAYNLAPKKPALNIDVIDIDAIKKIA